MEKKDSFFDIVRFEGAGNTWVAYLRQDTETKESHKKEQALV